MMIATPKMESPGWASSVKQWLENLIQAGSGKKLPVVFDFDNTIVCGDIGEATLAMLVRDEFLKFNQLPESLLLPFVSADGKRHSAASPIDLTEYYEALLSPTVHGTLDPTPLATGYAWAVEIMRGLSLGDVVRATQKVHELSRPHQEITLESAPGHTAYPVPFFRPEIIELIMRLQEHEFDIWIVSASNVWSVRWLVLNGLNPLLRALRAGAGIAPDHVIGVSVLVSDTKGYLYKDAVLLREQAYVTLQPEVFDAYRLTSWLQYPVPTYSGKVGVIWDAIGKQPYLAVGDSPGDHPMLAYSENRLWIARLEKPDYQKATLKMVNITESNAWAFQPVLCRRYPSFVPSLDAVPSEIRESSPKVRESIDILSSLRDTRKLP